MQTTGNAAKGDPPVTDKSAVPFGSNEVRLSPRQCVVSAIILVALFYFIPTVWEWIEPLRAGPDYRIPARLGQDYWTYNRYCREVCAGDKILVVGDSVIWGDYVNKEETLSHYLNKLSGEDRFANMAVAGIHPAAMAGLVEYYGRDIRQKKILLHYNPLWISSQEADLRTPKERLFNHPRLVPQFFPRVPCYRESVSRKLGIVVGHRLPLLGWANHLRIAYFEDVPELRRWTDFPTWTREHPYDNPAGAVTLKLPSPNEPPSPKPVAKPWREKGIRQRSFSWVELDTSLQWNSFKRTIEILRRRDNRVFVLVGPFNEHMVTEEGLRTYVKRKREVEAWLKQNRIAYFIPSVLPTEYYADASHPLADGYKLLADVLFENESFVRFRAGGEPDVFVKSSLPRGSQ